MSKDTHGPAFPVAAGHEVYSSGMTLRDWFAGQALVGLMAACPEAKQKPDMIEKHAATAFKFADAMLAERGKGE